MEKFILGAEIFLFASIVLFAVKAILDVTNSDYEVTWNEYIVVTIVVGLVLSFGGVQIGWAQARNSQKSFNEIWGGWENGAWPVDFGCTKDGPCIHEYPCDHYITYTTECNGYDKDGKCTGTHQEPHDNWHACPVYTKETSYLMSTNLDQEFEFGNHCVDLNPVRWGIGSSDYEAGQTAVNACVGIPPAWEAVNYRVNVIHQPGPAFKKNTYENLVIAADEEMFKKYDGYVQEFLAAGILPMVVSPEAIHDYYLTEPIYAVGWAPQNPAQWQEYIRYLDGAVGEELHGTTHVVIIQSPIADRNPQRYITTLKAYWQDPKFCGDNCFPKNGILIVVGTTDGSTVAWARAETGMPVGNRDLINHAEIDLVGVALTPDALIGRIIPEPYVRDDGKNKVRALHPNPGAIETLVWGLKFPETKFVRISMKAKDADDVGTGFNWLEEMIRPTKTQQRWIVFWCSLLSLIPIGIVAANGERPRRRSRSSSSYFR